MEVQPKNKLSRILFCTFSIIPRGMSSHMEGTLVIFAEKAHTLLRSWEQYVGQENFNSYVSKMLDYEISFEVHCVKIKLHGAKILDKMYSASEICTVCKFRQGNCVTDCLTFLFLFSENSKRQTPGIDEDVSLRHDQQNMCKGTKLWLDPWISTRLGTLFLCSFFWLDACKCLSRNPWDLIGWQHGRMGGNRDWEPAVTALNTHHRTVTGVGNKADLDSELVFAILIILP